MTETTSRGAVPPCRPLYQYEESLRHHVARVTAIRPFSALLDAERALFKNGNEQTWALECNETIFYAQGGGQPYDTGSMAARSSAGQKENKFIVEAVRNAAEGRVLHFGHFEGDAGSDIQAVISVDDFVEQCVDGQRRDLHSRIHTAGHIVALAALRLAETTPELKVVDGKAQHYPEVSFVEFVGLIDGKFKDDISTISNTIVKNALPINIYWCKPDEVEQNRVIVPQGMPVLTGLDGMVRVVDIVGAGAYPCGGTHTPDTSYTGEITIRNIKRQKGVTKVSYVVAGQKD